VVKLLSTVGCAVLLAMSGCGQAVVANHPSDQASPPAAQPAPVSSPTQAPAPLAPATPAPPVPTPAPPTPPPAPPAPAISLSFGPGSVTVSVAGIANGAHQVHVHRDCTGNPNLHITTLGDVFANPDGSGSRTFSLAPSLRNRGFDLLVYPLGASQGPPTLCAGI
jgi:hypothetical protein